MFLIRAKREQQIRASYPEYFRQVWREKNGVDPLIKAIREQQYVTIFVIAVVIGVLGLCSLLFTGDWESSTRIILSMLAVAFLSFVGFDACRSSAESFRAKLAEVSACLGRTNEQLAELSKDQLARLVWKQLDGISGGITLLEEFPTEGGAIVKEAGIHILRTRFQMYRFWELVPDKGKGEDGWKILLTPRA